VRRPAPQVPPSRRLEFLRGSGSGMEEALPKHTKMKKWNNEWDESDEELSAAGRRPKRNVARGVLRSVQRQAATKGLLASARSKEHSRSVL
jgi:hypothetical protein